MADTTAFVWIWLPGTVEPVVAGRLDQQRTMIVFTYGRSYLERENCISLYLPELPLRTGPQPPLFGDIAGCIADSGPDSWGQRVIDNRNARRGTGDLSPLTYLLESGSDRIGALDFQASPTEYIARESGSATLDELLEAADRIESGTLLSPTLDLALLHGSSAVGGARPKALLSHGARRFIAKFGSTTDTTPVVKAEFVAMELARRAGIDVAAVDLTTALGKDVLLVERFDRTTTGSRRAMVSALTILGLDPFPGGRYATYVDLAHQIRARFTDPEHTLHELFARITFNILCGNTDDHGRNHAAFWDGRLLTLTPAYDIVPSPRSGEEAQQVMAYGPDGYRSSQVAGCVDSAAIYHLTPAHARDIIDHQITAITANWSEVCDRAELSEVDRARMWRTQFLNPFATYDY